MSAPVVEEVVNTVKPVHVCSFRDLAFEVRIHYNLPHIASPVFGKE